MGIWKRLALTGVLAGLVFSGTGAGCIITIDPNDNGNGNNNSNDNDNGNDNDDPTPTTIIVRILNASDVALDPEVYLSAEELRPDDLFVRSNKFTRLGIGDAGVLDARSADSFEVDCEELRVLGTSGGRFGDNLREPDGIGRRLLLTRQLNVFCGDVVTFTYEETADGFTTTFDVEEGE